MFMFEANGSGLPRVANPSASFTLPANWVSGWGKLVDSLIRANKLLSNSTIASFFFFFFLVHSLREFPNVMWRTETRRKYISAPGYESVSLRI